MRAQFQSLARELGSHMLHGAANKQIRLKKRKKEGWGDNPGVPVVSNLPANAGDTGSISPGPGGFQVLLCNHAMHHNY